MADQEIGQRITRTNRYAVAWIQGFIVGSLGVVPHVVIVDSYQHGEVPIVGGAIRRRVEFGSGSKATHGRGGNTGRLHAQIVIAEPFVVGEEEKLVLDNWPANCRAKLILGITQSGGAAIFVPPGIGGESAARMQQKEIAVEVVGSTPGDHDHFAAIHIAELGVGIAGDDVNFLKREGRGVVADGVLKGLIDIDAVQNVAVRLLAIAVE